MMTRNIFFGWCMLMCLHGSGQWLKTEGERIVNDKGENVLLRGMGLGGWMLQEGYMMKVNGEGQQYRIREQIAEIIGEEKTSRFYEAWLNNHLRKIDVDSMKAWGFNSIRLPMHYELYTLASDKEPVPGEQTWIEKGFALTDSLLSWCRANGMYLILDLHAAPGGQGNDLNISDRNPAKPSLWDSPANQQKTIALWRKLATRYANEPWIGGYDIINEPNWGFSDREGDRNGAKEKNNAPLGKFLKEITAAIREVDTKHMVIIEGNGWGNNYNGFDPDWDKNMVLSFHKYWNYNDTASIRNVLALRRRYHLPVWLGETGENSNVWFTDAIRLFESNNIGWAWWPLKKIGSNNPEEIVSNRYYDSLVSYINKRPGSSRPDAADTYKGLMELANNAKLENTIIHRDVLDAMFRQSHTDSTKPFKKLVPGIWISAADYDLGRNRFAYYDVDTANFRSSGNNSVGNRGRVYRNDGVDIHMHGSDRSYYVSDIETGEWLQYTVEIPSKGRYTMILNTASAKDSGRVNIEVAANKVAFVTVLPVTGNDQLFKSTSIPVTLDKGLQVIRIRVLEGGFNFKEFMIRK